MSALVAPIWSSGDLFHPEDVGADWPRGYALLLAHLTPHGQEQFRSELAEAVQDGKEQDVIERWWVTLLARHDPGYEQHLGEGLQRTGLQSTSALRGEVLEMRAWWNRMVLRHDPGIRAAFAEPTPPPAERRHQSTADLRAEVEALVAG